MAADVLLHLLVDCNASVPLGAVREPREVPEVLRHVADYYEQHPAEAALLLADRRPPKAVPRAVAYPFAAGAVGR